MLDIGIAVVIALLLAVTAYLGTHITMHPAETSREKFRYKAGFAACGLVGCILIGIQAWRNNQTQSDLKDRLSRIEVNTKTPPNVQVTNNIPPVQVIPNPSPPLRITATPAVVLDCSTLPFPVSYRSRINILDPGWSGIGYLMQAPGAAADALWPSASASGFGSKCDLIDDSSLAYYSVEVKVPVGSGPIVTDANGTQTNGPVASTKLISLFASRLESNGGKFQFFIGHSGTDFVKLDFPDTATIEDASGAKRIIHLQKLNSARSSIFAFPFRNL